MPTIIDWPVLVWEILDPSLLNPPEEQTGKNTGIGGSMRCSGHANDPDPVSQKSRTVPLCWATCISLSAKRFVFKIYQ